MESDLLRSQVHDATRGLQSEQLPNHKSTESQYRNTSFSAVDFGQIPVFE